jgi:hypothetical protein
MPTHLMAHLQFAQANAKSKNCKRAIKANAQQTEMIWQIDGKMTRNKEHQAVIE